MIGVCHGEECRASKADGRNGETGPDVVYTGAAVLYALYQV